MLEELRSRSLQLYNRIVGLSKSEEKRFYVFFNEFRLETYVTREVGETINDRNDRAVLKAVELVSSTFGEGCEVPRRSLQAGSSSGYAQWRQREPAQGKGGGSERYRS